MTYEVEMAMDERCSLRDYTKFVRRIILLDEKYATDWIEYDCSGNIKLHNVSIGTMRKILMMFVSLRATENKDVKLVSVIDKDTSWYPGRVGHKSLTDVLFKVEKYPNGFTGYDRDVTEDQVWSRFKQAMIL